MTWSLIALSCTPFLLMTLWVLASRRTSLRTLGSRFNLVAYVAANLFEQALTVAQVAFVWRAALLVGGATMARSVSALFYGLVVAGTFLDAALFTQSGIRLQRSLLSFREALTEFADGRPWRAFVAAVVASGVTTGLAMFVLLGTERAMPFVWSTTLLRLALTLGLACAAYGLRAVLPLDFSYEWDSRFIASERMVLMHLLTRARPTDAGVHEDNGLPYSLRGGDEQSEPLDPKYPLLRNTHAFNGDKTFDLRLNPGEKPHVVFVFLESFRAGDVGALGAPHRNSVTPNFDKLAREGVLWSNFYANGTITSRAMTAAFYGVLPDFRAYSMQAATKPPPVTGMPQIFAQAGYHSAYFCDGPMDWENKRDFFLHHGFETFHGAPSIRMMYPEAPTSEWNFPDEYLMKFHAEWLQQQDAQGVPTFSSLLTVTNHEPFWSPEHAPHPDVEVDPETPYGRYLRTTMYTDYALGMYMDLLREKGLDKKTIIVVLGDHGQQVEGDKVEWTGRYNDASVRVPLLLLAPGRVAPKQVHETASQIDLLPTIMDALSMGGVHHSMGASLMRQNATRTALTIHPWAPGMVSNRVGPYRFVWSFDAKKAALYDLRHDPHERHDISALHPELVAQQTRLAHTVRKEVDHLHGEWLFAPESVRPALTWPRGRGLREDFPLRFEDCENRARVLTDLVRSGAASSKHLHELGVYLMMLRDSPIDQGPRLLYAQLMLARLRMLTVGELTRTEIHRLAVLDAMVNNSPRQTLPVWLRATTEAARRLAGLKPLGVNSVHDPRAPSAWQHPSLARSAAR